MARHFVSVIDLANLAADPATTGFNGGEMYWNTALTAIRVWTGSAWVSLGAATVPSFVSTGGKWGTD